VFHYTGLGEVSWFQFAREILQKANADGMLSSMPEIIPIPTEKFPTPAKRPKYSVLNTSKISSTGIQPQDWVPGVHKVLRKLKSDSQ
jgi:dTDP-4-dehydrorhamnose reductase